MNDPELKSIVCNRYNHTFSNIQPWVVRPASNKIFIIAEQLRSRGKAEMYAKDMAWPLTIAAWARECRGNIERASKESMPPAYYVKDEDVHDRVLYFGGGCRFEKVG